MPFRPRPARKSAMSAQTDQRLRMTRALFIAAMIFALTMASLPHPPELPGQPSDKIQHILAFTVLSALASLAYPRSAKWKILLSLSFFGALIEVVQAIPALHRNASLLDWLADTAAITITLGLLALVQRMTVRRTV